MRKDRGSESTYDGVCGICLTDHAPGRKITTAPHIYHKRNMCGGLLRFGHLACVLEARRVICRSLLRQPNNNVSGNHEKSLNCSTCKLKKYAMGAGRVDYSIFDHIDHSSADHFKAQSWRGCSVDARVCKDLFRGCIQRLYDDVYTCIKVSITGAAGFCHCCGHSCKRYASTW
jgi:hypothetical protein